MIALASGFKKEDADYMHMRMQLRQILHNVKIFLFLFVAPLLIIILLKNERGSIKQD